MAFNYAGFGGGHRPDPLNTAFNREKMVPRIIFPGGSTSKESAPAPSTTRSATARATSAAAKSSGIFSAWVNRPNNMPAMQELYLKNMGALAIHRMGPRDAAVNKLCGLLAVLGTAAVLYQMTVQSLGINKKKK
eukprot:CFRG6419T1